MLSLTKALSWKVQDLSAEKLKVGWEAHTLSFEAIVQQTMVPEFLQRVAMGNWKHIRLAVTYHHFSLYCFCEQPLFWSFGWNSCTVCNRVVNSRSELDGNIYNVIPNETVLHYSLVGTVWCQPSCLQAWSFNNASGMGLRLLSSSQAENEANSSALYPFAWL